MSEEYPICPIWHEECPPACMLREDKIPPKLSHPPHSKLRNAYGLAFFLTGPKLNCWT